MALIDIVVIGGGPGGLHAAAELGQRGFQVVVLEEHSDVGDEVLCTGVIGAAAFENFAMPQETVVGDLQQARARGRYGTEVVYTPSRPLAYIVDKKAFNRALARRALAAGVEMRYHSRVVSINNDTQQVCVTVRERDRYESTVRARLAVIACGVHYRLAKQLGFGVPQEFLQGAQAEVPGSLVSCTEVFLDKTLSPDGFGWIVPLKTGHSRVGLMAGSRADQALAHWLDRLLPDWRQQPGLKIATKPIAQGRLRCTYANRVLVVGEAAGQIKCTTGGGIYYAMLCAQLAVQTIVRAFAQLSFAAPSLAPYERTWQHTLGTELRVGRYFRKLYSQLQDKHIDALLRFAARNGLMELIHHKADFDWHSELIMAMLKHTAVRRTVLGSFLSSFS